jgi:DNA-binding winged helix-turn-helix (wHTH) protein
VSDRRSYEFGQFRLDARGRILFRGTVPVPLPPKAVDTLLVLVQNAGAVINKEDIFKQVWKNAFVEEGSLTRTISILRKALEHDDSGQK